jgi:hypothetical protein
MLTTPILSITLSSLISLLLYLILYPLLSFLRLTPYLSLLFLSSPSLTPPPMKSLTRFWYL